MRTRETAYQPLLRSIPIVSQGKTLPASTDVLKSKPRKVRNLQDCCTYEQVMTDQNSSPWAQRALREKRERNYPLVDSTVCFAVHVVVAEGYHGDSLRSPRATVSSFI